MIKHLFYGKISCGKSVTRKKKYIYYIMYVYISSKKLHRRHVDEKKIVAKTVDLELIRTK